MPKGYWIVHVDITDPEGYQAYIAADGPVFAAWGAKILVRGGQHRAVEGASRSRHVVIEFESYEAALACYHSPEYQAAAELRRAASRAEVLILEGAES